MTEAKIQDELYLRYVTQNHILVVPNSCLLGWEADMILVTKALVINELEIKISKSDLKADMKKPKHKHIQDYLAGKRTIQNPHYHYEHPLHPPANYFWFVIPEGLLGEYNLYLDNNNTARNFWRRLYSTQEIKDKSGIELPEYAGLMQINQPKKDRYGFIRIQTIKKPQKIHKEHLTAKQQTQLGKALMWRYWVQRLHIPEEQRIIPKDQE